MSPRYLTNINYCTNEDYSFECELEKHLGETVTVFTTSGGESGSGFTGILLYVNQSYIKLISQIGPPPSLIVNNQHDTNKSINKSNRDKNKANIYSIARGTGVIIPLDKIVSFVYNSV